MEGRCALSFSSSKTHLPFYICNSSSRLKPTQILTFHPKQTKTIDFRAKNCVFLWSSRHSLLISPPFAVAEALEQTPISSSSSSSSSHLSPPKETPSKVDKSGRFCSPRAARELALLIAYAACLDGSDPVRLFDKRVNATRFPGFIFDKASLLEYDHMSFGGPPVPTETEEEAEELQLKYDNESAIEEDVLSAPPKLVYNRSVLRLGRNILEAVVDRWDQHILVIDKITPPNWKNEPAGRILELCLLHLAMAEITTIGTRHQIVINEAVDLAKRFCDGTAPRIINGCLRTFVKDYSGKEIAQPTEAKS